jgi:hypothetical protein
MWIRRINSVTSIVSTTHRTAISSLIRSNVIGSICYSILPDHATINVYETKNNRDGLTESAAFMV